MIAVNGGLQLERPGAADHLIPRDAAFDRWYPNRFGKGEGVWGPGQHSSIAFHAEDNRVALFETECIPHCLWDGHLPVRCQLGHSLHRNSLLRA